MTKILDDIKLVTQDDNRSCTLACVAMLIGRSLKFVRENSLAHLNISPPIDNIDLIKILAHFQITYIHNPIDDSLYSGKIYIVGAPSLNHKAKMHSVLVDIRDDTLKVFDPQQGIDGKEFYTEDNLSSFSNCIQIIDIYPRG